MIPKKLLSAIKRIREIIIVILGCLWALEVIWGIISTWKMLREAVKAGQKENNLRTWRNSHYSMS